jgi:cysteinyl-tRNA synthetase
MIETNLGMPIDIHGGGHDLIFPHHENELAQGRCAHGGEVYARYWMHNGFLTMDAEKMSKSLGNVLLLHELVKLAPGEVVRWALLSAHYRAPLDWTDAVLEQSREALDRFHQVLIDARRAGLDEARLASDDMLERGTAGFFEALYDDLNTPGAFARLFVLYREFREALTAFERKTGTADEARVRRDVFLHAARTIGFLEGDPEAWFQGRASDADRERIETLVAARGAARAARDWAEADRIRDALAKLGVEVMDGPQGATWRLREG